MFDARIFPESLDNARKILAEKGAVLRGEYTIHDIIYSSKDPEQTLDKVFLRLRLVPQNIWEDKSVIVAIKNTELRAVGKTSIVPLKKQFDTEAEAREFIEQNYSETFEYSYEFDRKGRQYHLDDFEVDLEDIEGHFSIEFKSKVEDELYVLLAMFGVEPSDVVQAPSVLLLKDMLKKA